MRKGAVQPISAVMITLIMIGIVGSVYFWGVPLINKRQDITVLRSSENFMRNLDSTIKNIASQGGRDTISLNVPGVMKFDGEEFSLTLKTSGTIYATGGELPLNEYGCSDEERSLGTDSSEILCVQSRDLGGVFETIYTLKYIPLKEGTISSYNINIFTETSQLGSQDDMVIIERESVDGDNRDTTTNIKLTIS